MCVALAVIVIIAYMVYNDYQVQQEIDRKLLVSKQKEIISESDELLLSIAQIPMSSRIISMLHNRILSALQQILTVNPNSIGIQQRISDIKNQLSANKDNSSESPNFTPPSDADQCLRITKVARRLRKIIRIEFNRGRLSQQELLREDKRLELMIYKIQFNNLARNIEEAQRTNSPGTQRQLLSSGIASLRKLNSDDPWMKSLYDSFTQQLVSLNNAQESKHQADLNSQQEKDEIDALFMPKKKW